MLPEPVKKFHLANNERTVPLGKKLTVGEKMGRQTERGGTAPWNRQTVS